MKTTVKQLRKLISDNMNLMKVQGPYSDRTPELDALVDNWKDQMEAKYDSVVDSDNISRFEYQDQCYRASDALVEKILEVMDEIEGMLEDGQFQD